MTLEEVIKLFERLEKAESPALDINLHEGIRYVMNGRYFNYHNREGIFSSFLKELQKADYPK